MSILKLAPACKDYLWGGTKLITDYGKRYDGARLAETWELSGHPDGPSVLASGPDAGKTLAEYLAAHPGALGGARAEIRGASGAHQAHRRGEGSLHSGPS